MSARAYVAVAGMQVRRGLAYRADFWIRTLVGFLPAYGLAWCVWTAVFASSGATTLGGFTLDGMLLYMVVVVLMSTIVRGNDLATAISNEIYTGGLNRYLVFPVSYRRTKYAEAVGSLLPALVQIVLFCGLFLVIEGRPSDVTFSSAGIVGALIAMFVAHGLYFLLSYPVELVAFWAENVWSLNISLRLVTAFLGGAMIPLSLFPDWARTALDWSPFPILFAVPAETLLGRLDAATWLRHVAVGIAWCILIGRLGTVVWRRGNRRYAGVGI